MSVHVFGEPGVQFHIASLPLISIVIPVYGDTDALADLLRSTDFGDAQVIVAATRSDALTFVSVRASYPGIVWTESERGRSRQMNAGAAAAIGDWILFLHADTRLSPGWRNAIADAGVLPEVVAGCFRFSLDLDSLTARAIELGVRLRVALFGLPYGDQGLFVRRDVFRAIGGYGDLPIMEDVDLVLRLRTQGAMWRSPLPARTSARRWQRDGWLRRTTTNVALILLYFAGVPPARLARLDGRKFI